MLFEVHNLYVLGASWSLWMQIRKKDTLAIQDALSGAAGPLLLMKPKEQNKSELLSYSPL